MIKTPTAALRAFRSLGFGPWCLFRISIFGFRISTGSACQNVKELLRTCLAGREVVLLPDNDAAGRWYARMVAGVVAGLGPARRAAMDWLRHLLAGGTTAVADVRREVGQAGFR